MLENIQKIQDALLPIVQKTNGYLADYILIILLIGTGLWFTFNTKFIQVRCFKEGMKKVFGNVKLFGNKNESGLSSFQALATAIAAQVGTGNIVGASGAILIGGPGAIFWMWIIAFLGMATIYAEAVLAQKTRVKTPDGEIHGGPVYYIKKAFPNGFGTFLAVFFSIAITLALGFMGSMVQSNSIAESCNSAFGIPGWLVGAILAVICAVIFIGGIQRIASVAEKIVPVMAILFLLGGFLVLVCNLGGLVEAIKMIFVYAFTPNALIGGGIGYAIKTAVSQGAKRGLFSNEAGMGSTPHAHAMANVKKPHDQGCVAMVGVFIDTFVVLTITALVVITMLYTGTGPLAGANGSNYAQLLANSDITKATAMQTACSLGFPGVLSNLGSGFVAICLLFFAFTTIISWNFFGKINVMYLFKNSKVASVIYSVIAVLFIFLGSLLSNDLVWELTDFFNYLMVIPNVLALIALTKIVKACALGKKEKAEEKTNA